MGQLHSLVHDIQFRASLPDVVQVEDVGVIDKLHDDDLTLDPEEDLVRSCTCF